MAFEEAMPAEEKVTSCWNQRSSAGMGELRFAVVSTAMAMKEPLSATGEASFGAKDGTGYKVSMRGICGTTSTDFCSLELSPGPNQHCHI